jgi:hypothetical protein
MDIRKALSDLRFYFFGPTDAEFLATMQYYMDELQDITAAMVKNMERINEVHRVFSTKLKDAIEEEIRRRKNEAPKQLTAPSNEDTHETQAIDAVMEEVRA